MTGIVKSQPVSGVQNLHLGAYHRKDRAEDLRRLSEEQAGIELEESVSCSDGSQEDAQTPIDPAAIYQQGFVAGAAHAESELRNHYEEMLGALAAERQQIERDQLLLAQQLELASQLTERLDGSIMELLSKADGMAVSLTAQAVKELVGLRLVNPSSIQQLVSSLLDSNHHASPLALHCGRSAISLLQEFNLSASLQLDDRLPEHAFELRTSTAYYSVDVEQYVREIFTALSEAQANHA